MAANNIKWQYFCGYNWSNSWCLVDSWSSKFCYHKFFEKKQQNSQMLENNILNIDNINAILLYIVFLSRSARLITKASEILFLNLPEIWSHLAPWSYFIAGLHEYINGRPTGQDS